mmetsp:Transcript_8683/g.9790  ORF Transcript_8683/g.9790 Transcript_8683/m.9790 type:complete len:450 (-) Transcript_8683:216-1565(-)
MEITTEQKTINQLAAEPKRLQTKPYLVGVAGGSGCGKTTLCNKLREVIENKSLLILSFDSFYIPMADPSQAHNYNFDAPEALDFDAAYEVVKTLMRGEDAEVPVYNFKTHQREKDTVRVSSAEIILFEGIFTLYDKRIRDLMNLKLFVLVDDDERLARRILRDTKERGRTIDGVLLQYHRFVKGSFEEFVHPTWKFADIVVPKGTSNLVAINFIVQKLRRQLSEYSHSKKNIKSDSYYGQEIFEDNWNTQKHTGLTPEISALYDKKYQKEFSKLLLLFNKSFSLDLYEMAMKRFIKAGLRLLRLKVKDNLGKYEFLNYPITRSPESTDFVAIWVVFFGEQESEAISKKFEEIWAANPNSEISLLTIFSNTKYLSDLQTQHKDKKLNVFNIICVEDINKLKYCLQKNLQNDAVNITQEEHYWQRITQTSFKYQEKHATFDYSADNKNEVK